MIPSVLVVIVVVISSLAVSSSYDVILESHASTPILSSQNGGRGCLAFNPSYLTKTNANPEGLFVRRCCGMTCAGHGLKSTSKASSEHAERIGFAACNITGNEEVQCDEVDADFNVRMIHIHKNINSHTQKTNTVGPVCGHGRSESVLRERDWVFLQFLLQISLSSRSELYR